MKIHIICRYNQARSIIGAAAIRKFFPDTDVISSGIEASKLSGIPSSVLRIAYEWGLNIEETHPVNFQEIIASILPGDLIIAADELVASVIEKLAPIIRVTTFAEHSLQREFIAKDPVNLDQMNLRIELAKSIACSLRAARSYLDKRNNINILIPKNEPELVEIQRSIANDSIAQGMQVIDTSLRVSTGDMWQRSGATTNKFSLVDIDALSLPDGRILIPKFEYENSERVLISTNWRDWLYKASNEHSILLLTPPMMARHAENVECILSSAHADLLAFA